MYYLALRYESGVWVGIACFYSAEEALEYVRQAPGLHWYIECLVGDVR